MKNDTCVYFHRRLDTNEVFYVGIGSPKRPYRKNNRNKWWHNISNKVGYEVEVIEENLTWDSACLIEIALIGFFGRRNLGNNGTLVNLTDGGEGIKGHKHSVETKSKLSAAQKGKKLSAETKANMSKAQAGNTNGAMLTEEIVVEILYKLEFHYYKGIVNDLAKQYGVSRKAIYKIKRNERWSHINRDSILLKEGDTPTSSELTDKIVTEIIYNLKFHHYHGMVNDLAKQYGVGYRTISPIKRNKTWKHIDRDSILLKEGDTPTYSALTDKIVIEILYNLEFHYYKGMIKDLAKQYGVHRDTISDIKNNKRWKHINRNLIIKKT